MLPGVDVERVGAYVLFVWPHHRPKRYPHLAKVILIGQFGEHSKVKKGLTVIDLHFAVGEGELQLVVR